MNKTDFISLIEQPETLGKTHITALKTIAADFPYFQNAQLLLTKALYNEKHYEFEKQLKYASIMHPDRAVLFRYIHNLSEVVADHGTTHEPAQDRKEEEPVALIEEPVIIAQEPEVPVIVETVTIPVEPEPTPVIEPIADIPEIIQPVEITPVEEEVPAEELRAEEIETIIPENSPEETTVSINPVKEEVPAPVTSETHSFMEWLTLQKTGPDIITEENQSLPQVEEPVARETAREEEPADKQSLSMQEEIAGQVERSSNVREFESILDKFIRENPRISRGKAEFYSPINMAKQSVEQDEEMVSETLANIYYKQGHYKKAIRVYEKLCLLYPHKLSYFADLIQKIKTENKD